MGIFKPDTDRRKMQLKDFIKEVLNKIEEIGKENIIGITFDLGLDTDMEVNENSPNRIKFSIKPK